jgi:DegV family protein with EDD domain
LVNIIVDSGCDINTEMVESEACSINYVPLSLHVEDRVYVDDEALDLDEFMTGMHNSPAGVKTAAPSPQAFIDRFKKEGSVFVVTLSSKLSGTYQSAILAKKMYVEEYGKKFIHVFDSLSASIAEGLIALKISEYVKRGLTNLEVVDSVNSFMKTMRTYFVLDRFDNLTKTGRINPAIAKIASLLNIKPVCTERNGEIAMLDKVRGYNKAVKRLIELIRDNTPNLENAIIGISHVKCYEKAVELKESILLALKVKGVFITEARGIVTTYANKGGVVVAV